MDRICWPENPCEGLRDKELAFDQRGAPRIPTPTAKEIFVDAQRVTRHGRIFEAWIQFLLTHRHQLSHIGILATNSVSQRSVEIMQNLSDTGPLVRLYSRPGSYDAALHAAAPPTRSPAQHLHITIDQLSDFLRGVPLRAVTAVGVSNYCLRFPRRLLVLIKLCLQRGCEGVYA